MFIGFSAAAAGMPLAASTKLVGILPAINMAGILVISIVVVVMVLLVVLSRAISQSASDPVEEDDSNKKISKAAYLGKLLNGEAQAPESFCRFIDRMAATGSKRYRKAKKAETGEAETQKSQEATISPSIAADPPVVVADLTSNASPTRLDSEADLLSGELVALGQVDAETGAKILAAAKISASAEPGHIPSYANDVQAKTTSVTS